ncbi:tRNA:m(4)X modification enzyme TRM13 homolog isoform X2 [Nelusetta ayraudi]|uniref:tRNA:m(4)X modification enzyme TRM13 homolog isoform X2 n=1 Tax=Nelusetta ayraudi TaxID=303726 RepID=UPI003F727D40
MAAPLPGSCGFFLEKKRRFCKMVAARGRRFCGEHATMEADSNRITCPLDPKHTVSADRLEKHLKKCNSRRKPTPVYYVENINSGPAGEEEDVQEVSLSELSCSQLDALVERLRTAARGLRWEVEEGVLSHPALQGELDDPRNGGSAHKHLEQQSSILGHLQALGLLGRGRCFVEFGAGRGKLSHWIHEALKAPRQRQEEEFSLEEPAEDLQLLLVERSSTRFKVDGKHQQGSATLERLQVDIQHLDLAKVPLLQQKKLPLVAVGKHLCGVATDLALRCLLGPPQQDHHQGEPPTKRHKACQAAAAGPPGGGGGTGPPPTGEEDSVPGSVAAPPAVGEDCAPGAVLGLVVALCCHHRCQWRHYVGQSFFRQLGLGAADFSAFCRMSSWATCGLRPANHSPAEPEDMANQRAEDEEEEHDVAEMPEVVSSSLLSAQQRHQVGLLCKRLIDGGRLDFLRSRGFSGRLRRYVDGHVTLENVLLNAVPSSIRPSV